MTASALICVTSFREGYLTLMRCAKGVAIDRRSTVAAIDQRCRFVVERSTVIDPVAGRERLLAVELTARSRP